MNRNAKFLLIVSLVTAVLVGGVASVYLGWSGEQRTKVSVALIENLTINFSDRASLYLVRDNRPLLSSTVSALLFSNVILYVQVIQNGELILDERTGQGPNIDLPIVEPESSIRSELRHLADGTAYLDVIKTLFPLESGDEPISGYVRIGRSLNELSAEIQSERLVVAGIGIGIWGLLFFGAWLTLRWFTLPKPEVVEESPSVESAVMTPETVMQPQAETGEASTAEEMVSDHDEVPTDSEPEPVPATVEAATDLRQIGQLALDDVRKYVEVRGGPVELSPKEFDLLKLLCEEPGKVYSNDEILKHIWAEHSFASAQDVKQYIYFLRRKLEENPKQPKIIVTVRGFGYKVETQTDSTV